MNTRKSTSRALATFAFALLATAWGCSESTTPTSVPTDVETLGNAATSSQSLATLKWVEIGKAAITRNPISQNASWRVMAYLTLAQFVAVERDARRPETSRASTRGAIAGAAVEVLRYLFPADSATFESALVADRDSLGADAQAAFDAGAVAGRAIGAKAVARAQGDRFNVVWTGSVPTGPGIWYSSAVPPAAPLLPLMGDMRTFYLTSGSQFRVGPPPAFGSPAFQTAAAEVRQFSDTRTAQQDSLAKYWAAPTGSLTAGLWNTIVAKQIVTSKLTERAAARTLALINTAGTDGVIACHDSKYQYWLLRPSQADAGIKLAIGLPNHPSYPSNHACISGSVGYVMGFLFPSERAKYADLATEASVSRLYGGIHYRFDMDSGLAIARKVSALVREADRKNALLSMLP